MSHLLPSYVGKHVCILTNDGRIFHGTLKGFDQSINLILENCTERIYSESTGVQLKRCGLYVFRGDSISLVGEIDTTADEALDLTKTRAKPIEKIIY